MGVPSRVRCARAPAAPHALQFVPPHTIRLGDRSSRVGRVVFQLLKTLFEAPDHARNEAELADAVWGRSVRKNTLWCACRRARHALVQIDHPLRVAMDGERVMLV